MSKPSGIKPQNIGQARDAEQRPAIRLERLERLNAAEAKLEELRAELVLADNDLVQAQRNQAAHLRRYDEQVLAVRNAQRALADTYTHPSLTAELEDPPAAGGTIIAGEKDDDR